ncbi:MAG: hypothetical protein EBW20_05670 [Betaproteobacteria bacterium]|nr:hypothetical protein [Betaproteobacteria bacterium]
MMCQALEAGFCKALHRLNQQGPALQRPNQTRCDLRIESIQSAELGFKPAISLALRLMKRSQIMVTKTGHECADLIGVAQRKAGVPHQADHIVKHWTFTLKLMAACLHRKPSIHRKRLMAERIASHTGQQVEQIERDSERDRWFTAQQAMEYGIVDRVIEGRGEL